VGEGIMQEPKSYGSVKLTSVKAAIKQIEEHYQDCPERLEDVEVTFEYLVGSFFPKIIDNINSWHFLSQPNKHFKNSVYGLYFHSGVVVLEKHSIDIPVTLRSGEKTFRNAIEEFKYSHTYISSSSFLKFVSWIVRYIFYSIAGNRNKKSLFKTHLKYWRLLKKN
jgi:hypothetical protein